MNWKQAQTQDTKAREVKPLMRTGFSWASMLAILMGVGIIAYLTWQSTKKTDTTNYAKGSDHVETTTTISPIYSAGPLSFPPCGRIFTFNGDYQLDNKAKNKK